MAQPGEASRSQSQSSSRSQPDQASTVWSSQLRIVAGRAVEEAPQIGFVEKVDRLGRVVRLTILAEPAADGADSFMDQFVQRVGELFDPAARSLTGTVRSTVGIVHEELRQWNRQHLPSEHAMYGMSCLVQRADQPAMLCQVGPSAALLAGDAGLADLRSVTLYTHAPRSNDPVCAPIGGSEPINVQFVPGPEAVDGWALLLTSNTTSLLDPERRVALSRLAVDDTLRLLYPAMLNLRDASALAVSLGSGSPPRAAPSQDQVEAESEPPDGDPPQAATDDEHDVALEAALETDQPSQATEPTDRAQLEQDSDPVHASGSDRSTPSTPASTDQPGSASSRATEWSVTFDPPPLSQLDVVGWPSNPFAVVQSEPLQANVSAAALDTQTPPPLIPPLTGPIMKLGQAIPSLLENRREPAVERPRIRTRAPRRGAAARRVGLALFAMVVLLGVVTAVLIGPSLLRSDEDQFRSRLELARNGLAASQLAPTTETATLALEDALSDVELALEINPLSTDAQQLRVEIEAVLAELNLVQSPGDLTMFTDLTRFGPAIALGLVRFGGADAFVLDDAGGRVFRVDEDGTATPIFLEGELLGVGEQLRAGAPISLAWQPVRAGSGDAADSAASAGTDHGALWILDSNARLYRWSPSGVLLVPIPDLTRLGSVDAITATADSVYLLDQAGGAIWRFAVERSELAQPTRVVGRTDLFQANELAATVNAAAEVEFLVASSDGRLRRFGSESELPLGLDLERELVSPASLSFGAQSGLIYVVDRGQGRLLAIGPEGNVVSQIQSPELTNLRGACVDEDLGRILYVFPTTVVTGRLPGTPD